MGALCSEDYEKVFGKPTKWTIFPEEEEVYEAFRQTIMDSPHYVYDKNKLPFSDINVIGNNLNIQKCSTDDNNANINDRDGNIAHIIALLQSPIRNIIGGL